MVLVLYNGVKPFLGIVISKVLHTNYGQTVSECELRIQPQHRFFSLRLAANFGTKHFGFVRLSDPF